MKIEDLFEGKGTKEQAGYIPRPKNGEKCINCTMWRDPNKCSAVAGDISPNGWCEWYAGGAYGKRGKRVNEAEGLGLTIFDIDETLMRTTAKIKVVKDGKVIRSLTNQEFNNYKLQPGEQFDFGEFRNAEKFRRESEPIAPMIAKLKAILQNAGDSKVIMLTARADFDDKETFLNTFRDLGIDMSRVHVHRAGNLPGNPAENKAVWIRKYLDTGKYSRVRLYDDSMGNIRMFNALAKEYPNVKFFPYLVTHEGGIKTVREDGRIVKGVNTTVDVGPDEIKIQAAKFGNTVDRDGYPPTLSKNVKGKSTNVLFNLGLAESQEPRYTAREWAVIEGGHSLEDVNTQPKKPGRIFSALDEYELEDRHPNEKPFGPEFKPTMPAGTIRVKVSDVYDWYKLGQHISDLKGLGKHDFGKGPPEAVIAFGSEEEEHKYIELLKKLGLDIIDVDPGAADAPGVKSDPTYNTENFADGKIVEKVAWGQSSLSKKLFDFEGNDFSSLEDRFLLPINSSVLKRLGADEVRATVFHVTGYDNLDTMIKNQNTQKALSTFFHMNPEKFTSGVQTSGGLVFELDANVLLASNQDIESQVDDSGRRWIPMEHMSQNTGEFNTSDLRDEVPELLSQLVKKYTNKNTDDSYGAWKKLGQSLNQKGDGKTLNLLIKDFFDGIYKIYEKHKDEIMKLLRSHLSDRTDIDYTVDWDEMISNNYKIKKIHVINTPELNKNTEILRNIKSTGIPYDIWNTGSKLSSHVKKTVDKEKTEYVANQEKNNVKPKSNFVIKSPPGFMWDEFRIFNLNNNGKIDLGSAIAKLSPEEQEWAKLRWQQGLRLGDIGKKYNLNNTQAIQKYQPIHDKIRQHLGIKESIFSNLQSIEENFADGKKKIQEVFTNPYAINWLSLQKTGESHAEVELPDGSVLDIRFTEIDDGDFDIEFVRNRKIQATGGGDEFRIFATVVKAIKQWWNQMNKDEVFQIMFGASKSDGKEDSKRRNVLYKRFAKQFAQKIGWVATTRETNRAIEFSIIRPEDVADMDLKVIGEKQRMAHWLANMKAGKKK